MIFEINNTKIKIEQCEGVFMPSIAARSVLEVLEIKEDEKNKKVLDLGTGTGIFAIYLALNGYKDILAVDYQESALECTKANIALNKVEDKIQIRYSDILSGIKPEEKFGLIVSNPSNLPEGLWKDPSDRNLPVDKELIGGKRGNEVMMTLIENIDNVMDKGRIIFLQPLQTNVNLMKKKLKEKGFSVKTLSRKKHKLSLWDWENGWKYDLKKLISKFKELEKEDNEKDYIIEIDGEPSWIVEVVEAERL